MKLFNKTQGRPSKFTVLITILFFAFAVFLIGSRLFASSGGSMYGYLWSSNIGWIEMNDCRNPGDSSTCNPSGSFSVSVLPSSPGTMSGYAWSSNIGWITFNASGCPTSGCTPGAHVSWNSDGSGTVHGWARACSVYASGCSGALKDDAYLGTWDGYIALDSATAGGTGGTWGLTITTAKALTGYAWGSEVIGWIKSINAAVYVGPTTVTPPYFTTPSSGGGGGGGSGNSYCSTGAPQFAWYTDATSCKIVRSDGASQTVLPTSCDENTTEGVNSIGTDGRCYYPDSQLLLLSDTTTYSLQCTGGSKPINYSLTVNACAADGFTLQAVNANGSTSGAEPFTINKDGSATATYTVSVIPDGAQFTSPVVLTVLPYQPATGASPLPADATLTFNGGSSTVTLTNSGGKYNTATFTITIPDSKELGATASYTPIVIEGVGGQYTRQAQVSANTTTNNPPIFKEF